MKRFIKSLALLAALCVVVLLSGCATVEAPPSSPKSILTAPSTSATPSLTPKKPAPTASTVARALSYNAKATPQTPKPVVTYNPTPRTKGATTPTPRIIVVGTDPYPCRLDVLVDEKLSNRARLEEAYRMAGCDYAFLLYMSDPSNCKDSMAICYDRFFDLDSTLYPPEIPAPRE